MTPQLLSRLSSLDGWPEFMRQVGPLAQYASTPGWEDDDCRKTVPSAKPIGMAQWGAAMLVAGLVTESVQGAQFPVPGVDPEGFIWLTWRMSDSCEMALELKSGLNIRQTYSWTLMRDGMPRRFDSCDLAEVIRALRSVIN